MPESTPVSTASVPNQSQAEVGQQEGSPQEGAEGQAPQSVEEQLQELQEGDFDKYLQVREKDGVKKYKVKEVVNRMRHAEKNLSRYQQALEQQKEVVAQQIVDAFKQSPAEALKAIGVDPEEFAEMTLKQKLQAMELSPEQRELNELKQWKQQIEAQHQKQLEEQQMGKQHQQTMQLAQSIDKELADAWKETGLPANKVFFQMAAAILHDNSVRIDNELKRHGVAQTEMLSAKDAMGQVKERFRNQFRGFLDQLNSDQLAEWVGEGALKKYREAEIKRVQGQNSIRRATQATPQSKQDNKAYTKDSDYRAYVESLKI